MRATSHQRVADPAACTDMSVTGCNRWVQMFAPGVDTTWPITETYNHLIESTEWFIITEQISLHMTVMP